MVCFKLFVMCFLQRHFLNMDSSPVTFLFKNSCFSLTRKRKNILMLQGIKYNFHFITVIYFLNVVDQRHPHYYGFRATFQMTRLK